MLANLEALAAVASTGTMTRAATRLRISQSAVSKRIAALAAELGAVLVEPDGRNVRLTPVAHELLARTGPLVAELRHVLAGAHAESSGVLVVGVSESILSSWGPRALAAACDALPNVSLELNAHRSPVALERVRSGEYLLALVASAADAAPDLAVSALPDEPMVLVPSAGRELRARRGDAIDVLTIERGSATWRSLAPRVAALRRDRGIDLRVVQTVQSFACVVQLAQAGFGHGLAPRGIARAMAGPANRFIALELARPVGVVARPMTMARSVVAAFCQHLAASVP